MIKKVLFLIVAISVVTIAVNLIFQQNNLNDRARQWAEIDLATDPEYQKAGVNKRRLKWLRSESQSEFEERMRNRAFFRVTADYTHKDRNTGEIEEINFDVVAVCTSVLMDPQGRTYSQESPVPWNFGKVTKDGGVAFLRIPKGCANSFNFVKTVPADFTPFVFWYDDVHKIGHGLGFATEDAFKSSIAPLQFRGATLTQSNFDEWKLWRKKQLTEFKPIGILQSPWGSSANGNEPEVQQASSKDWPQRRGWSRCGGKQRLPLPADVQARLNKLWPGGAPDFWFKEDAGLDHHAMRLLLESDDYRDGSYYAGRLHPVNYGIITRTGGGALQLPDYDSGRYAGEFYPTFPILRRSNNKITHQAIKIDFRPEMKGFIRCGSPIFGENEELNDFGFSDGDGVYFNYRNILEFNLNSERSEIHRIIFGIFESVEYVWIDTS